MIKVKIAKAKIYRLENKRFHNFSYLRIRLKITRNKSEAANEIPNSIRRAQSKTDAKIKIGAITLIALNGTFNEFRQKKML